MFSQEGLQITDTRLEGFTIEGAIRSTHDLYERGWFGKKRPKPIDIPMLGQRFGLISNLSVDWTAKSVVAVGVDQNLNYLVYNDQVLHITPNNLALGSFNPIYDISPERFFAVEQGKDNAIIHSMVDGRFQTPYEINCTGLIILKSLPPDGSSRNEPEYLVRAKQADDLKDLVILSRRFNPSGLTPVFEKVSELLSLDIDSKFGETEEDRIDRIRFYAGYDDKRIGIKALNIREGVVKDVQTEIPEPIENRHIILRSEADPNKDVVWQYTGTEKTHYYRNDKLVVETPLRSIDWSHVTPAGRLVVASSLSAEELIIVYIDGPDPVFEVKNRVLSTSRTGASNNGCVFVIPMISNDRMAGDLLVITPDGVKVLEGYESVAFQSADTDSLTYHVVRNGVKRELRLSYPA